MSDSQYCGSLFFMSEEIPSAPVARKILIDNKLYILVDDILYDATGKRVR